MEREGGASSRKNNEHQKAPVPGRVVFRRTDQWGWRLLEGKRKRQYEMGLNGWVGAWSDRALQTRWSKCTYLVIISLEGRSLRGNTVPHTAGTQHGLTHSLGHLQNMMGVSVQDHFTACNRKPPKYGSLNKIGVYFSHLMRNPDVGSCWHWCSGSRMSKLRSLDFAGSLPHGCKIAAPALVITSQVQSEGSAKSVCASWV